jgi:predicted Fe-S protein YdhL (DUF1289 family)
VKTLRQPCGCRYSHGERERWLELCPEHRRETNELHARAVREHHEAMARIHELNRQERAA